MASRRSWVRIPSAPPLPGFSNHPLRVPRRYSQAHRTIAKAPSAGSQFFRQAGKHIRPGWCLTNCGLCRPAPQLGGPRRRGSPSGTIEQTEVSGRGARKAASVSDLARVLPWAQDEAELVMELQCGSDAAFDWLVTHYHAPVYSLIFGVIGDSADAADVTQEVFLKAFRGIRGFRRGSSLMSFF